MREINYDDDDECKILLICSSRFKCACATQNGLGRLNSNRILMEFFDSVWFSSFFI